MKITKGLKMKVSKLNYTTGLLIHEKHLSCRQSGLDVEVLKLLLLMQYAILKGRAGLAAADEVYRRKSPGLHVE